MVQLIRIVAHLITPNYRPTHKFRREIGVFILRFDSMAIFSSFFCFFFFVFLLVADVVNAFAIEWRSVEASERKMCLVLLNVHRAVKRTQLCRQWLIAIC